MSRFMSPSNRHKYHIGSSVDSGSMVLETSSITSTNSEAASPMRVAQAPAGRKFTRGMTRRGSVMSNLLTFAGAQNDIQDQEMRRKKEAAEQNAVEPTCFTRMISLAIPMNHGKLSPESRALCRWDTLIAALLLCSLMFSPFRGSFLDNSTPTVYTTLMDLAVSLVFAFDMLVRFHVGFYEMQLVCHDRKKIATRYLRNWFFPDLLACIPAELIFFASYYGGSLISCQDTPQLCDSLSVAFWLRTLKGLRLFRLDSIIAMASLNLNRGVRRLFSGGIILVLTAHCFACAWYVIASWKPDGGDSWVKNYVGEEVYYFKNTTKVDLYVSSLYWTVSTMTSVGFGDITGQNSVEIFFSTLVSIFGAIVNGMVIAYMSSIAVDLNETNHRVNVRMKSIRWYLRYRKIPLQLQRKIIRYFRHFWIKQACFDEHEILSQLTNYLSGRLSEFLLKDILESIEIFSDIKNPTFLAQMLRKLRPVPAQPGDYFIREGDPANEIYLLVRGQVRAITGDGLVLATMGPGNHFGEIVLAQSGNNVYLATVQAITSADCFTLSRSQMVEMAQLYPSIARRMGRHSKRRETEYNNIRTKSKVQQVMVPVDHRDVISETLDVERKCVSREMKQNALIMRAASSNSHRDGDVVSVEHSSISDTIHRMKEQAANQQELINQLTIVLREQEEEDESE